jgi:hypothetical protein
MKIAHVMLGTNDVDKARAFYDAVLSVLGYAVPRTIRNMPMPRRIGRPLLPMYGIPTVTSYGIIPT